MKMYKIQKRTTRKRKNCQKASEKHAGKSRKLEGNRMSQRLTIPPEFFRTGVEASTSNKSSNGKEPKEEKDNYGVDNFHGLFDKCLNIRRSERILKRSAQKTNKHNKVDVSGQENLSNSSDEINDPVCSSISKEDFNGIFNKCLNINSYENYILNPHNRDERKGKHIQKRSKGIFDEINHLCTRSSQKFKRLLNNSSQENDCNSKFCSLLHKQLNRNIAFIPSTLLTCKSKIFSEINNLENSISGKVKMDSTISDKRREYYYEQEDSHDLDWKYFSKSEWVYQTPPAQKMISPKLEDNHLQPAVIYTSKKHTQIFEFKKNAGGLSNFDARNDIVFNKKVMNHLVTLNNTKEMVTGREPCSSKVAFADCIGSQNSIARCDNALRFTQANEKDDTFNIFARPSKKLNRASQECSQTKRRFQENLSQDLFSNCKLNDCRKSKSVRNVVEENRNEIKKKLPLPSNVEEFKLNISKFKLDQCEPDFSQDVDGENDFFFKEPDSVVGFDFKNAPCSSKNQMGF